MKKCPTFILAKLTLYFWVSQIALSCTGVQENGPFNKKFEDFSDVKSLEGKAVKLSDHPLESGKMLIKDSILIIENPYDPAMDYLHFYNVNTFEYLGSTGRKGRGPGEFMSAAIIPGMTGSNDLHVYDGHAKRFHFLNQDSILNSPTYASYKSVMTVKALPEIKLVAEVGMRIAAQISDSTFLAIFFPAFDERFAVVNSAMEVVFSFGDFPNMENRGVDQNTFALTYQSMFYQKGNVAVNHTNHRMVLTHLYMDLIEIYDYHTGEKIANIIGPDQNYPPEYEVVNWGGITGARPCKDCKMGYPMAAVSHEYIYALYPDKPYYSKPMGTKSRYIYQFDWDGNPVRKYDLGRSVDTICLDQRNKKFFVFDTLAEDPLIVYTIEKNGELSG